ncbi:hypothetical protein CEUSTIGMA_g11392.t1 [Chlamydomonas eustigma]|uniref:Uncharacterized protein n=1 Tax=Chlamydomonas eustigma TaxID=1157962 RepID=A0A250XLL7_9CHLO|nr:hypothetical protein CEUSTIGMA_g11392.t1 [Chlamydomonas eustigma]|eukprot:GAX83968.1 hypothetical protein CEUSTIGMA_g11392.t1 [Chlamydomonas eustigma]
MSSKARANNLPVSSAGEVPEAPVLTRRRHAARLGSPHDPILKGSKGKAVPPSVLLLAEVAAAHEAVEPVVNINDIRIPSSSLPSAGPTIIFPVSIKQVPHAPNPKLGRKITPANVEDDLGGTLRPRAYMNVVSGKLVPAQGAERHAALSSVHKESQAGTSRQAGGGARVGVKRSLLAEVGVRSPSLTAGQAGPIKEIISRPSCRSDTIASMIVDKQASHPNNNLIDAPAEHAALDQPLKIVVKQASRPNNNLIDAPAEHAALDQPLKIVDKQVSRPINNLIDAPAEHAALDQPLKIVDKQESRPNNNLIDALAEHAALDQPPRSQSPIANQSQEVRLTRARRASLPLKLGSAAAQPSTTPTPTAEPQVTPTELASPLQSPTAKYVDPPAQISGAVAGKGGEGLKRTQMISSSRLRQSSRLLSKTISGAMVSAICLDLSDAGLAASDAFRPAVNDHTFGSFVRNKGVPVDRQKRKLAPPSSEALEMAVLSSSRPSSQVGRHRHSVHPTVSGQAEEAVLTVPGTVEEAVPTVPGTVEEAVPTVPGTVEEAVPTVPGTVEEAVPTVPGTVEEAVPTVPGTVEEAEYDGAADVDTMASSLSGVCEVNNDGIEHQGSDGMLVDVHPSEEDRGNSAASTITDPDMTDAGPCSPVSDEEGGLDPAGNVRGAEEEAEPMELVTHDGEVTEILAVGHVEDDEVAAAAAAAEALMCLHPSPASVFKEGMLCHALARGGRNFEGTGRGSVATASSAGRDEVGRLESTEQMVLSQSLVAGRSLQGWSLGGGTATGREFLGDAEALNSRSMIPGAEGEGLIGVISPQVHPSGMVVKPLDEFLSMLMKAGERLEVRERHLVDRERALQQDRGKFMEEQSLFRVRAKAWETCARSLINRERSRRTDRAAEINMQGPAGTSEVAERQQSRSQQQQQTSGPGMGQRLAPGYGTAIVAPTLPTRGDGGAAIIAPTLPTRGDGGAAIVAPTLPTRGDGGAAIVAPTLPTRGDGGTALQIRQQLEEEKRKRKEAERMLKTLEEELKRRQRSAPPAAAAVNGRILHPAAPSSVPLQHLSSQHLQDQMMRLQLHLTSVVQENAQLQGQLGMILAHMRSFTSFVDELDSRSTLLEASITDPSS